jgi:hypothetical protein
LDEKAWEPGVCFTSSPLGRNWHRLMNHLPVLFWLRRALLAFSSEPAKGDSHAVRAHEHDRAAGMS